MEDLGNINITIRETRMAAGGGGAGGGGGAPGGGPGLVPPLPGRGGAGGGGGGGDGASPAGGDSWQDRLERVMAGVAEARALGRAPSVGGFASAASATGSTASGLSAIAPVLAAAAPAVAAAAAAVGLAVGAIYGLRAAAEATAARLEEVGRFSSDTTYAQAMERVAQMQRNLSEAGLNAGLYATAQIEATRAADAWAPVLNDLRAAMAALSVVWHRLSEATARLLAGFGVLARMLGEALDALRAWVGPGGGDTRSDAEKVMDSIAGVQAIGMGGIGGLAFLEINDGIKAILKYLGLLEENTKPKPPPAKPNEWFLQDIRAMTGRPY
jgi:hypothetical protein